MHPQDNRPLRPGLHSPPSDLAPSAEEQAFELALAGLRPRTHEHSRDALLFEAGRQSVLHSRKRPSWTWSSLCAGTGALAASLLMMALLHPEPPVVVQTALVPTEQPSAVEDDHGQAEAQQIAAPTAKPRQDSINSQKPLPVAARLSGQNPLHRATELLLRELASGSSQSGTRATDVLPVESTGPDAVPSEGPVPQHRLLQQWLNEQRQI